MNRADALSRIAELHTAWSLQHGDDVPYNAADEEPHDGQTTDLSLWQADRSAPAEIDDPLNEAIKEILAQIDEETPAKTLLEQDLEAALDIDDPASRAAALDMIGKHLPGKHDQSSHGKGGSGIRDSLQDAKTTDEVSAVLASEASALTGRTVTADLTGADVDVAQEYAEGCLRGYERFPNCQVDHITTYGPDSGRRDLWMSNSGDMAVAGLATRTPGGVVYVHSIGFNTRYSNDYGSASNSYMEATKFTVRGGHMGTALHEYGHHVARTTGIDRPGGASARQIAVAKAKAKGVTPATLIRGQISHYASKNQVELTAEAFADVMYQGEGASDLSRAIFDEMSSRYESRNP